MYWINHSLPCWRCIWFKVLSLEWILLTGCGFLFICCWVLSQLVVKIIIEKKKKKKLNHHEVLSKLGQNTHPDFYSWWSWFHLGTRTFECKNTIISFASLVYLRHRCAPNIWQHWKSFSGNEWHIHLPHFNYEKWTKRSLRDLIMASWSR